MVGYYNENVTITPLRFVIKMFENYILKVFGSVKSSYLRALEIDIIPQKTHKTTSLTCYRNNSQIISLINLESRIKVVNKLVSLLTQKS